MSLKLHPRLVEVTERIKSRSAPLRQAYLQRVAEAAGREPVRKGISCANLAHAFAAMPSNDKIALKELRAPNLGIVTAYNDMLSAHQPYEGYPEQIRAVARANGATAQVASGVPAMCDGVTQGQDGMELSLFSRDVIAMSTAIGLSHQMFDAVLCLGICDKIVPGLLMAALQFGHLPTIFVPAGPMASGISNKEKARIRQLYAEGKATREELLASESASYHSAGTCTFYGTANSNQMLMEIMGLHLPGSAFIHPGSPLRDALTAAATMRAIEISGAGSNPIRIADVVDERAIVNAIVGLHATGGSTNHTIHLIAIARAAGIVIDWQDFDELSGIVPLLARVYPNGSADVNHFHAAGGIGFVIRELLDAGLLHEDVMTIAGPGLRRYASEPTLTDGRVNWVPVPAVSGDDTVVATIAKPFSADGGLRLLKGNLGRAVIKVSAVAPEHRKVRAAARVFDSQDAMLDAFKRGELERDLIAVIRFQGPRANGMPELHKLTPPLGVLQDRGFKVALVTDGRMSGASGKVPAAIHVTPECLNGGWLARVQDEDIIELDADAGSLRIELSDAELAARVPAKPNLGRNRFGMGRELFEVFRRNATGAEQGAVSLCLPELDEE
ncbi:phosphogluconate dehydratase [Burkholderiaceae bacterium DAT-1]|nr:phosphogluconate dehydratase [Burkholderiaceae bacterium DAT-1]